MLTLNMQLNEENLKRAEKFRTLSPQSARDNKRYVVLLVFT